MLKKRVIVALGGILLISTAVWFDRPLPWFTVFVACYGLLAVLELYRLVAVSRVRLLAGFGLVWTLLFILSPHFDYLLTIPLLLASAMVLPLVWLVLRPRREGAFTSGTWAIVGVLYVGWLLSFLVALRLEAGRNWVFFALVTTFGSDTLAFFVGWVLGKHRLAPSISPNKTWEGAVAGVFGAVIVGLFFTLATPLGLPLGYGQVMLLGLLVSIFGQLGDLVESLLKRKVGVKESGNTLPGHGGFLDRMDSVVFAGVVVYLYCVLIARIIV
ncbi:MAG: phosphatidate cytidylyltransferase [Dehalococcoidales bacterium]|jgi:phosphatidate cytidylyltransferase|nr:phosphatidate cytidylyltransferase [Dehalococcoidales bacterium]MDP7286111.1 phosphatidate cytidylyltransferase [Dehalococcoidales bacterium]MDP7416160.1 phosphatidate cytidylyltransferase [Dehalococcoidales bacterium]